MNGAMRHSTVLEAEVRRTRSCTEALKHGVYRWYRSWPLCSP